MKIETLTSRGKEFTIDANRLRVLSPNRADPPDARGPPDDRLAGFYPGKRVKLTVLGLKS